MTTLRRTSRLAALVLGMAVTSMLAGCGDDDDDAAPAPTVTVTETAGADDGAATSSPPADSAASATPRPGPDQSVILEEAPDGRYQVFDAGTAVVTRDGDRLTVGEVTPAEGWDARVETEDRDEVEIEFRRGQEQLDLEIEIDDGVFEAQISDDDD